MTYTFKRENSPQPLYQQVADWMLENIRSGNWEQGDKLPAEEDLAKLINISRGTLRNAIAVLIEQELLIQVQGKGTFVSTGKISYPFAQELASFAESMASKDIHFTTKVLEQKVIKPNPGIHKKLGLDEAENVLYLKRLRFIKGQPATLLENWIALNRCPGIEHQDFEVTSLFNAIEKGTQTDINFGIRNFSAKILTADEAKLLDLAKNDPVLYIDQITFGHEKVPLECSKVLLRTDKYQVTSVLTR